MAINQWLMQWVNGNESMVNAMSQWLAQWVNDQWRLMQWLMQWLPSFRYKQSWMEWLSSWSFASSYHWWQTVLITSLPQRSLQVRYISRSHNPRPKPNPILHRLLSVRLLCVILHGSITCVKLGQGMRLGNYCQIRITAQSLVNSLLQVKSLWGRTWEQG